MSTTADLPVRGQREHEAALALIAERNRVVGRRPGDYSEAEYIAATAEAIEQLDAPPEPAAAGFQQTAIREALQDAGFTETARTPSDLALHERTLEILAEQGLREGYSQEDYTAATRIAIRELPAEQRAELAERYNLTLELSAAEREQVLDRAVKAGVVLEGQRDAYRLMLKTDPVAAMVVLDHVPVDGYSSSPVYVTAAMRKKAAEFTVGGVRPDERSLRLVVRAEELGLENGWATRHAVTGELEWPDSESYMRACLEAESEFRSEAESRAEANGTR